MRHIKAAQELILISSYHMVGRLCTYIEGLISPTQILKLVLHFSDNCSVLGYRVKVKFKINYSFTNIRFANHLQQFYPPYRQWLYKSGLTYFVDSICCIFNYTGWRPLWKRCCFPAWCLRFTGILIVFQNLCMGTWKAGSLPNGSLN